MAFGQPSLKGRALRLLAGREFSRAELQKRLAPHEQEPGELQRVLDELQGRGFVDEQRVVDSHLHRRAARLGAGRIRQELQQRGIAPEQVAEAVAGLQASELERARDVWRRKFGEPAADAAQRAKQVRFLLARGFNGEVVRKVVAGASDED